MSNLPAELIHLVIDQWRPILKALSLVNKHFNHLVTPILYEKVSLKSHHSMKAFGETLRNGRSILRQYPRFLHLSYLSYATESFNCNIIQILAQVPNIIELNLSLGSSTVDFILKEPHYPFSLLRLSIVPRKNASFVEFLKMQPQIRHIILKLDRSWSNYDHRPEWSEISSPLDPSILPKLESIQSEKVDACFLIPCRPVTSVSVFDSQEDLSFHEALAKSSAPLKCLAERIQLKDYPWESDIVSWCLPSLEFCQESLVEYSLGIFPETFRFISNSASHFLRASQCRLIFASSILSTELQVDPSNGLARIRDALSAFSELKKFNLSFRSDQFNDLTPDLCTSVPELAQFQVWKDSCPKLEEVTVFGITLRRK